MMRSNAKPLVLALLLFFVFVGGAPGYAQERVRPQEMSAITASTGPVQVGGEQPWVVRSRLVEMDLDVLHFAAERAADEPRFALQLFDDLSVTVEVRDVDSQGPERYTLNGVIPRMIGSSATVTVRGAIVSAYISLPRIGQFNIRSVRGGQYRVTQIDPSQMPVCGVNGHNAQQPLMPANFDEAAAKQRDREVSQQISAETIIITLLVFFTDEAAATAGSVQQLVADVVTDVNFLNTALTNSQINVQVKLLGVARAPDYLECNDFPGNNDPLPHPDCMATEDLQTLIAGGGDLAVTHEWRATMCADLVSLIVSYGAGTGEPCGIAQVLPPPGPSVTQFMRAFSVVDVRCMPGSTLAHEIGHNLGSGHDHAEGATGTYPYSHGHRFPVPGMALSDPPWRTIMSYPPGIGVPHFSNPNVLFQFVPTGIPAGLLLEADNFLTFTSNAPYIASYSDMVCLGATHRFVPGGYPTIQAAIDAAQDGDHIVVAPGTYSEALNLLGKAIYLRSASGSALNTFLDGTGIPGESIITCNSGEGQTTVVQGFTIRNGFAARGAGINLQNSSPSFLDCRFVDNQALLSGGGAYLLNSDATFLLCEFIDNTSMNFGGGMFIRGGDPWVSASIFEGNEAGLAGAGKGAGLYIVDSEVKIRETRIGTESIPVAPSDEVKRNRAGAAGGGVYIEVDPDVDESEWILPTFSSTTVCGNLPGNIAEPWIDLGNNEMCPLDVDINVPVDYPTIQAAIDSAADGDVILVAPGTYLERIDLKGKEIELRSFDPTDPGIVATTIIDGQGGGSVVKCTSGETSLTRIRGFTITGGNATGPGNSIGGGIRISNGSPLVEHCVIMNNHASSAGGGIHVASSASTIQFCTFIGNTAGGATTGSGGGLNLDNSTLAKVRDCVFIENHSNAVGGGLANNASENVLRDLVFVNNTASQWGGGMFNGAGGAPTVLDSSFSGNSASLGGGIYTSVGTKSMTVISQSTFCENMPNHLSGPWFDAGGNSFLGTCPPLNNSPEAAQPIGSPIDTIVGSFTGATNNKPSSCEPNGVDVFYTYTVLGGLGNLSIDTCGSSGDTALAVFDSSNNELACNTECAGSPCGAPHACVHLAGLSDGEYLIRVSRIDSIGTDVAPDEFLLNFKEVKSSPADLNLDGVVDVSDLLILLGAWGECANPGNCLGDLNGDGKVDVSDMLILLGSWG